MIAQSHTWTSNRWTARTSFICAAPGVEWCLDIVWSSATSRIHNVIIGLSGIQHVHTMLPAAGVNAFMESLFFVAGECASSTNLELLGTEACSFLHQKGEETRIQMGINGAECMQVPMAQDHAGQIHKEVFRAENQAKLDSTHAAFLLAHQSI